jgi:hypothetical protein
MDRKQKLVLTVFLTVTAAELVMIIISRNSDALRYFEFAVTAAMLVLAVTARKRFGEQKLIAVSFLFTTVGEFFLLIYPILKGGEPGTMQGLASFLLSYVFLIAAFQRKFRWSLRDFLMIIPFLCAVGLMFAALRSYLAGAMLIAVTVFCFVITVMAWSSLTTLSRGYFAKRTAGMAAAAGVMIFASDFGAAFQIFYPPLVSSPSLITESLVRVTFVAAWTLLLAIVYDKDILRNNSCILL